MTIPNIGYKANSTYERDAIFDELEKMGWPVEAKELRGKQLSIERSGDKGIWQACSRVNFNPAKKYYYSPESFLSAAREALKPKYPTETLHAKCNSPFELRGCIQALHEAGVPVHVDCLNNKNGISYTISWHNQQINSCFAVFGVYSRELPLSEFMDIFLKPEPKCVGGCTVSTYLPGSEAEPKRETPPKIVGRKYRLIGEYTGGYQIKKGDVVTLIKDDGTSAPQFGHYSISALGAACILMTELELLPEEPWTDQYGEDEDVWVRGKASKTKSPKGLFVKFGGWAGFIDNPNQIRKA